ncbi:hypothetical protein [Thermomonospora umbrina]|uniref:Uncharacterized protein n=1 Tax=Thermomonospora umbrina TaxID=111806 RepID=A0A3D9TAC2_9ACTN|nr:hypothetical protein [Thermomonospora umbrina]REF00722.1 hypothetical protein DFJ69_6292 [Thermomonospora umbrina]
MVPVATSASSPDVLELPELTAQATRRTEMHRLTVTLVEQGIASRELHPIDPGFTRHAITGLLLEVVRERGASPSPARRHAPCGANSSERAVARPLRADLARV